MSLTKELVSMGLHGSTAAAIGGSVATGLSGAGATQATATPITAVTSVFSTVALSQGAILPGGVQIGDELFVRNGGANALAVYPPVGGTINGGAANAAFSVTAAKGAVFKCLGNSGLDFIAILSA